MRERLIELLNKKYDHFCDQCGVNKDSHYTENLADYLLDNGVIVPPCKAGDVVYKILPFKSQIEEYEVRSIEFYKNDLVINLCWSVCQPLTCIDGSDINKTVFLTKEEAEQALKGVKE